MNTTCFSCETKQQAGFESVGTISPQPGITETKNRTGLTGFLRINRIPFLGFLERPRSLQMSQIYSSQVLRTENNHEGHEDHEEFIAFLRVLRALRGEILKMNDCGNRFHDSLV